MFTKQTSLLERLRGIPYADQIIDALTATYHNCAVALFHRAPVNVEVDGGKLNVPNRTNTQPFEQYFSALNISNQAGYYDLSADTIINGAAANFAGVTVMQPSTYVQGNAAAFKAGVENNIVLAVLNGGAVMVPNALTTTIYDIDGTTAATVSGSTVTFSTIIVTVAIGAQANRVPQVWLNNLNAQAQPAVQAWFVDINDAVVPVVNLHVTNLFVYVSLNIVSTSATAFTVSRDGTNYIFQIDCSTASAATGIKVKGAAAGAGAAISVISSGTNENLTIDAKGSGTVTIGGTSTGAITLTRATNVVANFSVNTSSFTVAAATGNTSVAGTLHSGGNFDVGTTFFTVAAASGNTFIGGTCNIQSTLNVVGNFSVNTSQFTVNATNGNTSVGGTLNSVGNFSVNTSNFTVAASSGNTVVGGTLNSVGNFSVNTSSLTVAASSGNTVVGGTLRSTGNFDVNTNKFTVAASSGNTVVGGTLNVTGTTTLSAALAYGGVTLANSVTGTGSMALSASPTFSGTVAMAAASLSGALTYGGVTLAGSVTGTGNMVLSAAPTFSGNVVISAGGTLVVDGVNFNTVVVGPGSATDKAVARYLGTSGKLVQNSVVIITDSGSISGVVDVSMSGTLGVANVNVGTNLDVDGNTTLDDTVINGTFQVVGTATVSSTLFVTGNVTADTNLIVTALATITDLQVNADATFNGDVNITAGELNAIIADFEARIFALENP